MRIIFRTIILDRHEVPPNPAARSVAASTLDLSPVHVFISYLEREASYYAAPPTTSINRSLT